MGRSKRLRKQKTSKKGRKRREIFTVRESSTQRIVVIKRYSNRAEAARELEVMESFGDIPNLVSLYGSFEKNGDVHIVMEQIKGQTLTKLIKKRGALEATKVIDLALDILAGVDALHSLGYIHGDLHGENVMVTDFDASTTKIIDFQHSVKIGALGTARAIRKLKKPPLMLAPESKSGVIDASFDVYGVGFMCASMLTGGKPERMPKTTKPHSDKGALWHVIQKAMRQDPLDRYRSAREMISALREVRYLFQMKATTPLKANSLDLT